MNELTTEQREVRDWAREFAARHITPRARGNPDRIVVELGL
jgi:hypothetical protein